MSTLYDRWRDTAASHGNRVAWTGGRPGCRESLTFAEIDRLVRDRPASPGSVTAAVEEPGRPELILATLQSWRDGTLLCPLEAGQPLPAELAPDAGGRPPLPDGTVLVKRTSGSAGEPKLVLFDADQIAADADQIASTMGLRPEVWNLAAISQAHSYGFSNLVLQLALHGVPLAATGNPLPATVREVLGDPSLAPDGWTVPAVPALWKSWAESGAVDPGRVRLAISAGAPLPPGLERSIASSTGIRVHNFYGASECGGIAFDRSPGPRGEADRWLGSPLDGVALSLGDDGCLVVESPAAGAGYWPPGGGDGDRQLGGGRFRTTDLAELTESPAGTLVTLTGRLDDVIHVAGRKVSPATVEAAVAAEPGVRFCLAFGVPSRSAARGDDTVVAVALDRPIGDEAWEALRNRAAGRLRDFERPRHWWRCDDLRADGRGKCSRAAWRQRFLDEATAAGAAHQP